MGSRGDVGVTEDSRLILLTQRFHFARGPAVELEGVRMTADEDPMARAVGVSFAIALGAGMILPWTLYTNEPFGWLLWIGTSIACGVIVGSVAAARIPARITWSAVPSVALPFAYAGAQLMWLVVQHMTQGAPWSEVTIFLPGRQTNQLSRTIWEGQGQFILLIGLGGFGLAAASAIGSGGDRRAGDPGRVDRTTQILGKVTALIAGLANLLAGIAAIVSLIRNGR